MLYKKLLLACAVFICSAVIAQEKIDVAAPGNDIKMSFWLDENGAPMYSVSYKNNPVILPSALGFKLKETSTDKTLPDADKNFKISKTTRVSVTNKWTPVWGDVKEIKDNYNQVTINLLQQNDRALQLTIVFKVFDDGVGFRYEFPEQPNLKHFIVSAEKTAFHLTGDHKAFWIPGDYDSNEFNPNTTTLSEVDASSSVYTSEISAKTFFDATAVQTPLMLKSKEGLYINIHEAALVNYPAMNLHIDKASFNLQATLVPDALNNMAYLQTPAKTPWRTIVISDKATDILASHLILNLNEPSVIKDPSWIKPTKFVGVWWEMHIGKGTWDLSGTQDGAQKTGIKKPHSANTANVKRYIDFASKNGIGGVLVEGWNTGWEDWFGVQKENVFDFVTPYPDFDVKELHRYAASKNVKIIMHHETSASVTNYERQMDTAYRFMKANGYDAVKTGYVGHIIPRGEHHDGQWMVNHYVRVNLFVQPDCNALIQTGWLVKQQEEWNSMPGVRAIIPIMKPFFLSPVLWGGRWIIHREFLN